jgi:hypothetical protein
MDCTTEQAQTYLSHYAGKKFDTYYKKIWDRHYGDKYFISFNVFAFIVPFPWLIYRKMYSESITYGIIKALLNICIFIIFLISVDHLELYFYTRMIIIYIIMGNIILSLLMGVFGNFLYLRSAKINISRLSRFFANETDTLTYLKKRECINKGGTILSVVFSILLTFLWIKIISNPEEVVDFFKGIAILFLYFIYLPFRLRFG